MVASVRVNALDQSGLLGICKCTAAPYSSRKCTVARVHFLILPFMIYGPFVDKPYSTFTEAPPVIHINQTLGVLVL